MNDKLGWGLLATGSIAKTFTRGVARCKTGRVVAVGSRTKEAADRFGNEFNIPTRHGSYEALLADPRVHAVYISTPHPLHAEWAVKAAEAGKHILCEKPLTLNHPEAMAVVEAARRHDVFLMEAFMYRCHPVTVRLVELLREKIIGNVRAIHATFSFSCPFNPKSRLLANDLGGGGILDVGCYCTSMVRLVAGAAIGRDFAEPIEVTGAGRLGPVSRVDEYAVASMKFPGDIVATLATGVQLNQENVVRIYGTDGQIFLPSPWVPSVDGGTDRIVVTRYSESGPREITVETADALYAIEADTVANNLDRRQAPTPAMTWDDTLGNMKTLDRWRAAIGLQYDAERIDAPSRPVHGRRLAVSEPNRMQYGRIPGVDKPVARLLMGVDNQGTMPQAGVMFDDYFERGGNAFDTAHIYWGGWSERFLGRWIETRGVRDKVVILDKGAHTPFCTPKDLSRELLVSLERLRTDYVDIYMLHRDNLDVSVGEFVDVLNEHKAAGRIRAFGGSNWTIERVEAANAYAASKGLTGFVAMSNQFSLARLLDPVWGGCLSSSDADSRAWFTRTKMALMPWSSQARGFFTDRIDPNDHSDAEMVRCWYADDNFERRRRAIELATKKGVPPIVIALAYVLCQPFPTFPLIGPRTIDETRCSMAALDVQLTPHELQWLNLEA